MDQRGVWATVAGIAATLGGTAVLAVAGASVAVLAVGALLLLMAILIFSSLLTGWPFAALSSRTHAGVDDHGPPASELTLPEYPQVVWSTVMREIHRRSPSGWLGAPGSQTPEISLRVSVALPGLASFRPSGEPASRMSVEAREVWLTALLESSRFTAWLRGLRSSWPWDNDPEWVVHGSGNPDLTELRFVPTWPGATQQPLMARCAVLTGWHPQPGDTPLAIELACDLMFNVLELDSDRRPGPIRHATTPVPAPGALSISELSQSMAHLFEAPFLAGACAAQLLEGGDFSTGEIGAWMTLSGVELERAFVLSGLRRVAGAHGVADHQRCTDWPLDCGTDAAIFVATFVADLLEQAGYRGVAEWITGKNDL